MIPPEIGNPLKFSPIHPHFIMNFPFQIRSLEEYKEQYWRSLEEPEEFWSEIAANFHWKRPWKEVLNWNFEEPQVRWFSGGKLNITENCLDRHLEERGDEIAMIWEPNDSFAESTRTFTYRQLHEEVMCVAAVLK